MTIPWTIEREINAQINPLETLKKCTECLSITEMMQMVHFFNKKIEEAYIKTIKEFKPESFEDLLTCYEHNYFGLDEHFRLVDQQGRNIYLKYDGDFYHLTDSRTHRLFNNRKALIEYFEKIFLIKYYLFDGYEESLIYPKLDQGNNPELKLEQTSLDSVDN